MMMESLSFTPAAEHKAGTVLKLLEASWKPLWNPELAKKLKQFDFEVYDKPDTVGACTLVTCLVGRPVGMVSYDPRQGPECGIIGYNCVIPEHQNKGFGRRQILEILRILRDRGFGKAAVSTGEEDFFIPAQRMYKACGFLQCARHDNNIEYEIVLK